MSNKSGKEKTVIIKNIVVTVLVIAFFVGVVLVFYKMLYDGERNHIIKYGEYASKQTAMQFNSCLSASLDAVKLTSFTVDDMLKSGSSNDEVLAYLESQTKAIRNSIDDDTTGLYGFINGEYLDGDGWVPDADYVPVERPWYIDAIANSGKITTIEPYLDAQTGSMTLTLAKSLEDGKSVIAFDVSLSELQDITEMSANSEPGDIEFIVDRRGFVIAHSDKNEIGKVYRNVQDTPGAAVYHAFMESGSDFFELDYGNSHYIVYAAKIQNDWHCISVNDATVAFWPLYRILIITIVAVSVIIVVLLAIMLNSNHRQLVAEQLNSQLSSTADIYISLHEIDLMNDTFSVIRNITPRVTEIIGRDHTNCRQKLKAVMECISEQQTRDRILDFVDLTKLDHRLKDRNTITCEFLGLESRWRKARFIVSERTPSGKVARVMFLVEDIDAEKRERDLTLEAVKTMNEQISSVANIYFSMHDIDLANDTLSEIKTRIQHVSELVGGGSDHAQATLNAVMDQMAHESSRDVIREFIDLSTLNERLKNTNTVTEEFLSHKNIWSRARFVVSKRAPDGRIEHVLWLVEGIDSEKRRRDKLAEAAETLNLRISSIANIFMTAHEIDIEADTITQIRSQSVEVSSILSGTRSNAQTVLIKTVETVVDPSYIDNIRRFINLSSLDIRMRKNDTISTEYLNKGKLWRRGRFVVSRRDENGRITRVIWLTEDINNEKNMRDELIEMSEQAIAASAAKSSFLSNMTRDIRTPVNAMIGMNEMILRESSDSNIRAYAENVETAGRSLLGIVSDILDFADIEAGKMKITCADYDLSFTVNDLANMIESDAEEKGLAFSVNTDPDTPKLLNGDEAHIKQVIMNLLTNAVKYTESGGVTLGIGFEDIPDDPGSVFIDVSVKDTGIGMDPERVQKLISDPEHDRSTGVKGLGINITKQLLRMMGSTLKLESRKGLGSEFSFRIRQTVVKREPLGIFRQAAASEPKKSRKYRAGFRAPDANVLVVDDVAMNLTVIAKLLKQTEMNIDTALSGEEALALASERKYDIIFLDQMMPGKTGTETLCEIRSDQLSMNIGTPVVCLTSDSVSGSREQYLAAGFDDYITKPVDPVKLEKILLEYLPESKTTVMNT